MGNPAICVHSLSTDGGAIAWYLVHQRWSGTGFVCVCVFPVSLQCSSIAATVGEWVRGYSLRDVFTRLTGPV